MEVEQQLSEKLIYLNFKILDEDSISFLFMWLLFLQWVNPS